MLYKILDVHNVYRMLTECSQDVQRTFFRMLSECSKNILQDIPCKHKQDCSPAHIH